MNSLRPGNARLESSTLKLFRQTQKWLTLDDDFAKSEEIVPVKETVAGTPPKAEETQDVVEVAKAAEPQKKLPAVDLGDAIEGTLLSLNRILFSLRQYR